MQVILCGQVAVSGFGCWNKLGLNLICFFSLEPHVVLGIFFFAFLFSLSLREFRRRRRIVGSGATGEFVFHTNSDEIQSGVLHVSSFS